MVESETHISFNGRYLESIAAEGYKHWSKIPHTSNTENVSLFIQRVHSEYSLFDIKVFNQNVIKRAEALFQQEKDKFIRTWNDYFGLDILAANSAQEVFELSKFSAGKLPRDVIFGSLYWNNQPLSFADDPMSLMTKYYGKSRFVLKKELRTCSTFCFGDSFDANPSSYNWKQINHKTSPKDVLFTLTDEKSLLARLKGIFDPRTSIPYIENHYFDTIKMDHVQRVILSKEEAGKEAGELELYCENFRKTHKIAIELIH